MPFFVQEMKLYTRLGGMKPSNTAGIIKVIACTSDNRVIIRRSASLKQYAQETRIILETHQHCFPDLPLPSGLTCQRPDKVFFIQSPHLQTSQFWPTATMPPATSQPASAQGTLGQRKQIQSPSPGLVCVRRVGGLGERALTSVL